MELCSQVRAIINTGHLKLLAGDLKDLGDYWGRILRDFPEHPAHGQESSSIPLTFYGSLILLAIVIYGCFL